MWLPATRQIHSHNKLLSAASQLLPGRGIRQEAVHTAPDHADVVVVGGGVVGASTAFHLTSLGAGTGTVLLEAHKLTSGTTWHSAAMLNTLRGNIIEAQLVNHTKYLASEVLEESTGVSTGYKRHGGLTVTANPDMMEEFRRELAIASYTGNTGSMRSPDECKELFPHMHVSDLLGGLYCETDGSVDPTGLTQAYVKGATLGGVSVLEDCPVEDIIVEQGKVTGVVTNKGLIKTSKVVLAAGAWSKRLGVMAGAILPLLASEHAYIVTDIIPDLGVVPNLRMPDDSIYTKIQNQTLFLGAFEANPTFWEPIPGFSFGLFDLNMEAYMPYLEALSRRLPILDQIGHRSIICGPESFTPDGRPLFGETPEVEGLFLNCAMNSRGIQLSGGLGREMAELLVNRRTTLDLHNYDIKRFHNKLKTNAVWEKQKTHEHHVKTYFVPYPTDQPLAARNMFRSPLHQTMAKSGAFFGVSAGWERPQFYLEEALEVLDYDWYGYYDNTRHAEYKYKDTLRREYACWEFGKMVSQAIASECLECRHNCVIFDNSSFGKIMVSGPDALVGLEWLSTNKIARPVGSCVYTLMLNDEGGVEGDLTVTRVDYNSFYLVTGSAALEHTLNWISRGFKTAGLKQVKVEDVTTGMGIINVQGPESRNILRKIIPRLDMLKFSQSMRTTIAGAEVLVVRLTYVGELGYELHVASEDCQKIFDRIQENEDIKFAGMEAMESLAVEKGYRHWPADLTQMDNPLEAGMGWVLRTKSKQFRGLENLLSATKKGTKKQLVCLSLEPDVPLNGSEPILYNGRVVGYIRRAAAGYTVKRMIGYGYAEGLKDGELGLEEAVWEVNVGGRMYQAKVHQQSLYDPQGKCLML